MNWVPRRINDCITGWRANQRKKEINIEGEKSTAIKIKQREEANIDKRRDEKKEEKNLRHPVKESRTYWPPGQGPWIVLS
jgi:hypothetical protein